MGNKIKSLALNFKNHWKTPPAGKYVSYKETAAYSLGGMGVQFIAAMVGQVTMSAACLLIGSIYKLKAMDLATITIVATVLTFVITPLRGMLLDNTKSKRGKFRPLIFWTGIPTVAIAIALTFIPPQASYITKLVLVGIGFNVLNIIYNQFFYLGYANLVQVMTPNTDERTTIITISSIVFSMAPTITGFLLPLIAKAFPNQLLDIGTYRLAFPIFCIIGLILSYISYFGTKERIVVPKKYVAKVNFWHGIKSVFSNKYFWILNVTTWAFFARGAAGLTSWVFVYQIQDGNLMAALTLVLGTASLIGMVAAPFLIKIVGKRNLTILQNIMFALCFGLMWFFAHNAAAILVLTYISSMFNSMSIVINPAMGADALDYQQWKTGERLEGFAGNMGMIGSAIGLGTAYIIPYLTQSYGLLENYDVLFDAEMRVPFFKALCLFAAIGGLIAAIPFLFYDLTEKKHAKIIADLKERALEENKKDGINKTQEELDQELATNTELDDLMHRLAHKHENQHLDAVGNNTIQLDKIIGDATINIEESREQQLQTDLSVLEKDGSLEKDNNGKASDKKDESSREIKEDERNSSKEKNIENNSTKKIKPKKPTPKNDNNDKGGIKK